MLIQSRSFQAHFLISSESCQNDHQPCPRCRHFLPHDMTWSHHFPRPSAIHPSLQPRRGSQDTSHGSDRQVRASLVCDRHPRAVIVRHCIPVPAATLYSSSMPSCPFAVSCCDPPPSRTSCQKSKQVYTYSGWGTNAGYTMRPDATASGDTHAAPPHPRRACRAPPCWAIHAGNGRTRQSVLRQRSVAGSDGSGNHVEAATERIDGHVVLT